MTKITKIAKSLLAVLLTLCMLVFLMPAAWADDNVQPIGRGGGAETKEPIGVSVARLGTPQFTGPTHDAGKVYIYAYYPEFGDDYWDFISWQDAFTGVIVNNDTVQMGDYGWQEGPSEDWIWIQDSYFAYGENTVRLLASGYNEVIIPCEILTISPPSDPVDKSDLSALIEAAEDLEETDYTPGSWADFTEALADAQTVSENLDATQEQVDNAAAALQKAMDELTPAAPPPSDPVDKSDLSALIEAAEDLDETDYTPDSWPPFATALANAQAVSKNPDAAQEQVDNAAAALQKAMDELTPAAPPPLDAVDKSALSTLIAQAAEKMPEDYTPASWAPFATALANAREVGENPDATQEQVDNAATALRAAMAGLRAKEVISGEKGSGGSSPSSPVAVTTAMAIAESEIPLAEAAGSKYFDDISGDLLVASIDYLYEQGIINGIGERSFGPAGIISRGDCMLMLVRAFNLQAKAPDNFADVPAGSYYYEAIGIAKALGIAKGDGQCFRPDAPITLQDMLVLIDRTLRATGQAYPTGDDSDLAGIKDQGLLADYARAAVATLARAGMVDDSGSGVNPLDNPVRAELALTLYKILIGQA